MPKTMSPLAAALKAGNAGGKNPVQNALKAKAAFDKQKDYNTSVKKGNTATAQALKKDAKAVVMNDSRAAWEKLRKADDIIKNVASTKPKPATAPTKGSHPDMARNKVNNAARNRLMRNRRNARRR